MENVPMLSLREPIKGLSKQLQAYRPKNLQEFVGNVSLLMPLLDTMANTVFFVKDSQACYQLVNKTLIKRSGFKDKKELLGLTSEQVFSEPQGKDYLSQDMKVLKEGREIVDRLELHCSGIIKLDSC